MPTSLSVWDIVLLIVVPLQTLLLAYCYHPRSKALLISLPVPSTIAILAIGDGVNIDNIVGLLVSFGYAHAARLLHQKAKLNIIVSITVSAVGYCLISVCLAGLLPKTYGVFFLGITVLLVVGIMAWLLTPYRREPGHRSPLAWYIKVPILFMVVFCLLIMKKWMGGFMAMFPMLGVIASYEARTCLYSICRQWIVILICYVPMLSTCWLLQNLLGLGGSLAVSWLVLLGCLIPIMRIIWKRNGPQPNSSDLRETTNAVRSKRI